MRTRVDAVPWQHKVSSRRRGRNLDGTGVEDIDLDLARGRTTQAQELLLAERSTRLRRRDGRSSG
eukprot:13019820-Alexandrium_andersonii.AAC.1